MSASPRPLAKPSSIHDHSSQNNNKQVTQSRPMKQKTLKPTQGFLTLTAIGVGAVISGDFFGWNYGLERGGFGGLVIATVIVCVMYVCVAVSLAELAAMYPTSEGAFAFSRAAFGPYVGFLCGFSESLEYVLLGDHFSLLFAIQNENYKLLWWAIYKH